MIYTIVVDKQSRVKPSSEKKEYDIEVGEELRKKGDVYDEICIANNKAQLIRRISLSKYNVTTVLEKPIITDLGEIKLELFEGDNYIYIKDKLGNQLYAEYLVKNDFNNVYVIKAELNSAIEQTVKDITLSVYQKLEGYSTTEEMNSAIKISADSIISEVNSVKKNISDNYSTTEEVNSKIEQRANSITSSVSSTYETKENASNTYATKKEVGSQVTQTAEELRSVISLSIGSVNLVSNADFSHKNTKGQYDLKGWTIDNNESSEPVAVIEDKTWLSLYKQTSGQMCVIQNLKPISKNEYYTLSFKFKNLKADTQSFWVNLYLKSSNDEIIKSYEYAPDIGKSSNEQRLTYTFQVPSNEQINYLEYRIYTYNTSSTYTDILITDIQLEMGKIATDWRPSQVDCYDKIEQYSKLVQTVDEVSSEISKKVGNDEIISKINQSAETVGIQADKINLTANDILNLIAGNSINLSSKNITITSDAFKVDKNGKVTCSDINIMGGSINLESDRGYCNMRVRNVDSICDITGYGISVAENSSVNIPAQVNTDVFDGEAKIDVINRNLSASTEILGSGITTPKLTQTSVKSKKKYIKKLNVNATELIKNADICLYNLKGEKAKSKKHIGLVIGEGYNCPNEVMSENGQGVEQYSMTSLAWKAIQEIIEENNNLKERIEKLEAK